MNCKQRRLHPAADLSAAEHSLRYFLCDCSLFCQSFLLQDAADRDEQRCKYERYDGHQLDEDVDGRA